MLHFDFDPFDVDLLIDGHGEVEIRTPAIVPGHESASAGSNGRWRIGAVLVPEADEAGVDGTSLMPPGTRRLPMSSLPFSAAGKFEARMPDRISKRGVTFFPSMARYLD